MKILLGLVLVATAAQARIAGHGGESVWGYGHTNGPATWPQHFPTCGGRRQSPVALVTNEANGDPNLIPFEFKGYEIVPMTATLINTGHSVQVNTDVHASLVGGSMLDAYTFHQFHFHWGAVDTRGSEHTMDGIRFPAELHMVHYRKIYGSWNEALRHDGGVAVLSVLLELSTLHNPHIQSIVDGLAEVVQPHQMAAIDPFSLQSILPNVEDYFTYKGSLTTPGCSEVVIWTVFRDTIPISSNQLNQFRKLKGEDGSVLQDNFRPVQPLNGRKVYRP